MPKTPVWVPLSSRIDNVHRNTGGPSSPPPRLISSPINYSGVMENNGVKLGKSGNQLLFVYVFNSTTLFEPQETLNTHFLCNFLG